MRQSSSFLASRPLVLLAMLLALVLAAGGGCSSGDAAPKPACKAGDRKFCRCADLSDGEKLCKADGSGFEACQMSGGGDCPGGELLEGEDGGYPSDDGPSGGEAREACPGEAIDVAPGKPVTIDGDTTSAPAKTEGSGKCSAAEAGENVFAVKPAADGKLKIEAQGLHDVLVYAREGDCGAGQQVACRDDTGTGGRESVTFPVTAGKTYSVFVDGKAGQAGKYSLTLSQACGDGKVEDGEACDDGNAVEDDGCNRQCLPAGDGLALGPCPGVAVHVWGSPVTFTGSTANMASNFELWTTKGTCGSTGVSAPDRVYSVTAHKTGTLTVKTTDTNFTNNLYAATACPTGGSPPRRVADPDVKACAQATGAEMTMPVTSGSTYYVFVDSSLNYKGTFTMTLSIQ